MAGGIDSRRPRMPAILLAALIGWLGIWPLAQPAKAEDHKGKLEFFERYIRPVLVEHCYECHSGQAEELQGEFRLDTRELIRQGGPSGPAIVPGDPEGSLLLQAIRYEGLEMPPTGRLSEEVVRRFQQWIADGAVDPRDGPAVRPEEESETVEQQAQAIDWQVARQYWAFQAPVRHDVPEVKRHEWISEPVDGFILAKIEAAGLEPNEPADRHTLIRRVFYDVIGLPPLPEDVERFLADDRPDAYARLVDDLLASPRFGERWARTWLDLARYAEDQAHIVGDDRSLCYPNAWLYRDWLITALNNDLPYDQFLAYQLAADLIAPDDESLLPALGFIGLGPKYYSRRQPEVMADEWEDRVDVVSRALLGLTVACARCHDHKFDPIPTEDYYALAGVFAGTEMYNRPLREDVEKNDNGQAKSPDDAMHIVREGEPKDLHVMIRGDVNRKGDLIPRRFLRVLSDGEPRPWTEGSGRRQLAEAIVSRDNPLTARVFVNRVWGELFGTPLVATPSNFGHSGELPSHPELLDDLAVRFMDGGWSIKGLVRELVLSSTYRQSSTVSPEKLRIDPTNRLVARMPRRRLSVEAWRDGVLRAAGHLDGSVGGSSIEPEKQEETRRTVYSRISRLELNRFLAMFDFPDPNTHAARRVNTTTPLQKLFVMNSPFIVAQADRLAEHVMEAVPNESEGEATTRRRVEYLFERLFARRPTAEEEALSTRYLEQASSQRGERQAWSELAHSLLATNEFMFLD